MLEPDLEGVIEMPGICRMYGVMMQDKTSHSKAGEFRAKHSTSAKQRPAVQFSL